MDVRMDRWSNVSLDLCMDACFDGWIVGGMDGRLD